MTLPLKKILAGTQASLHLVDDQFLFVWKEKDLQRFKFISPVAVRNAVAKEPLDTGWIPPVVRRCGSGPRGDWAVAWFPPRVMTISVVDKKQKLREISVPLPGLLFLGLSKAYSVFATKGKTFSSDAALYRAPLPNVGGGGLICWGANRIPRASATTIEAAFEVFRVSPFNGHQASGKSVAFGDDVRDQLLALAAAKATKYPERDLVPAKTSVDRAVSALLGARGRR